MDEPLVTWYIPVFNGQEFLAESVQSILDQDFDDWECLLIDDASTDRSPEILAGFRDPRVKVYRQPANMHVAHASNLALRLARGKYLARLDQDDIALPRRTSVQVDLMESDPGLVACGTAVEFFGDQTGVACPPCGDAEIKANLLGAVNCLANPSSMVRTAFLREHNILNDPRFPLSCDFVMWVDCALAGGRLVNLPEPLTRYRIHAVQGSSDMSNARLQAGVTEARIRLLHAMFPDLPHRDVITVEPLFRANAYVVLSPDHAARGVEICETMLAGSYQGAFGEDVGAVRRFIESRRDEWRQHLG